MEFEYYRQVAKELIEDGREDRKLYEKIDRAFVHDFDLPEAVSKLPGMRKFVSTDAHDAMAAAIKTLAGSKIDIDVISPHPGEDNAKIAEQFEVTLQHQWYLANKRSVDEPFWKMVEGAVKKGKVALQVEHIDNLTLEGKRAKYIKRNGDYVLICHDVGSVYEKYSPYALEGVLLAQQMRVIDVREIYGDKANELIDSVKKDADLAIDEYETYACIYDWTDYDKRLIWAEISNTLDGGSAESVILKDEENKLPFLNWVVRKTTDPLMKAVVESGLIDNFNILLSLRYYTVAALAAWPRMWSITPTGEGVDVDWTDVGGQIQMRTGETAGMNLPPHEDNSVNNVINDTQSKVFQATQISRALTSLESIAPGTAFSTINAMREAGIASLGEIVRILQNSLEDVFCHMLYWSQYVNKPMKGRRRETQDMLDSTMMQGAQISLDLSQYNLDEIEIDAHLAPDTMTDKQGRRNLAIMDGERLHLGHNHMWEIAGIEGGKQSFEEWKAEQMDLAQLEADKKLVIGKADVEIQKQMAAAMQPQQATPPAGGVVKGQVPQSQGQPQFQAAQGMNNQAGMNPVAPMAPQATREQVTSTDQTGAGMV